MPTPYPGNPIYPVNVSSPIGSDHDDAATAAVPIQQLADRTAYLKGVIEGTGPLVPEFTNAILHGATTLPDGSLTGSISLLDFDIAGDLELVATGLVTISAGADLAIQSSTFCVLQDGLIVLDAVTSNVSIGNFSGAIQISAPDVTVNGTTYLHGALRLESVNLANANVAIDASSAAYEYICPNPSADRAITFSGVAPLGRRVRFNAQKVTGSFMFQIVYGLRMWNLRNATGYTVAIEFVSDSTGWIVDAWEEGGKTMRNG